MITWKCFYKSDNRIRHVIDHLETPPDDFDEI